MLVFRPFKTQKEKGVVCEEISMVEDIPDDVCHENLSKAFYGEAYKALKLVGLTGTKGKTTTTYFIKNILDKFCNMLF